MGCKAGNTKLRIETAVGLMDGKRHSNSQSNGLVISLKGEPKIPKIALPTLMFSGLNKKNLYNVEGNWDV